MITPEIFQEAVSKIKQFPFNNTAEIIIFISRLGFKNCIVSKMGIYKTKKTYHIFVAKNDNVYMITTESDALYRISLDTIKNQLIHHKLYADKSDNLNVKDLEDL